MNQLAPLRYLVALAEHRHFGRAAQACHITQPALSNAMRALEKDFGVVIVQRGRSFAGFTPEGERVLASARRMLHEFELLQQDLRSTREHPAGTLRIGVVPTAVPVAARFAARLQALHPGIVPVVRSLSSQDIEAGLEQLTLDLGLGFTQRLPAHGGALRAWPQYVESYYLVQRVVQGVVQGVVHPAPDPAGSPQRAPGLRIAGAMTWAAAASLPLCLLTPEMHNRTVVDAAFAQAGSTPVVAMQTNSVLTLALAVRAGQVSAVLPGALVGSAGDYPDLQALLLREPDVRTPIGFMTLAGSEPSQVLGAALTLATDPQWLADAAAHTGTLGRSQS